ncbi:YeeE/YedE family protein [Jiella sp. MQZ9-1]|uniref:YeeE/YedE family protein n=1 Tax=Jiella flava TaxID=2816857 RepID=A0A939JSS9_9HYPH|nr:YeeE/YedE family protein [Jiella flava]MBO0663273.1 YeeE/YedE family protein [Jiella flava]MCD2471849.1 YeeE/YedE family protein [Jiella flava]
MEQFTPLSALIGGALIGLSAVMLLVFNGRIAGISGIFDGALRLHTRGLGWRLAFLAGLFAAAPLLALIGNDLPNVSSGASTWAMIAGGLLVGFGSRLGSGCTSGHGVCGIGRASPRSLVATATFMAAAIVTVFVSRHLLGA